MRSCPNETKGAIITCQFVRRRRMWLQQKSEGFLFSSILAGYFWVWQLEDKGKNWEMVERPRRSAWQETIAEWLFLWVVDFVRAEEQILVMCLIEEILRQLESSFSINRVLDQQCCVVLMNHIRIGSSKNECMQICIDGFSLKINHRDTILITREQEVPSSSFDVSSKEQVIAVPWAIPLSEPERFVAGRRVHVEL